MSLQPSPTTPDAVAIPPRTSRIALGVWGPLFGLLCLFSVIVGIETAVHFLGPAIDGPFQLYNSLRRIQAGQRGGVDFQFFHGLAIPYLHYLPFRLLGGNFFASEATRELVSGVLYPITVFAFLKFFIRDWARTLAWATIVMAASFALRMSSVLVAVNSLLGVRSTLPIFLAIVLCLPMRRWPRSVLAGLVVGGALALGTEQGIATVAALVIATAVMMIRSRERKAYAIDTAVIVGVGIATLLLVLTTIGGVAGMRAALTYNFRYVPMDQYWYFGSPPNLFLSSWSVVPRMMMGLLRIPIALLVGCIAVTMYLALLWRESNTPASRERFAFCVLAMYGLISCASLLGSYANAYVQPLLRVVLLLWAVELDRIFLRYDPSGRRPSPLGVSWSLAGTGAVSLLCMFFVVPGARPTLLVAIPHVFRDHVVRGVGPAYAGIWPETFIGGKSIVESRRDSSGRLPSLWSTYAGLLEARNGVFQPSFDYIIHALGPQNREKYVADFRRLQPRLVQTVDPNYTLYEVWIENTSWDFYLELLQHYQVIGRTPWSLFWERSATAVAPPFEVWRSAVSPGADSLLLPVVPTADNAPPLMLLQVEIDYHARNAMHALPIIGGIPRYLVAATDVVQRFPVTVDPYTTTTRFPLLAIRGKAPVLHWSAESLLPGARLDVRAVRLYVVQTSPANEPWFKALVAMEAGQAP